MDLAPTASQSVPSSLVDADRSTPEVGGEGVRSGGSWADGGAVMAGSSTRASRVRCGAAVAQGCHEQVPTTDV